MAKKRKTKEEKIIAQLRRELKEARKDFKKIEKKEVKEDKVTKLQPLASSLYLKRDLTKALILSILAIGIELVLYCLALKGIDITDLPAHLKMFGFAKDFFAEGKQIKFF